MKLQHDVLLTEEQIKARVLELGAQISKTYQNEKIVLIGVLKGSFIFLADLARAIKIETMVEFIGVSSYEGTHSTGHVRLLQDLSIDIKNSHVLLVEDIVDTGRTLVYLKEMLQLREPLSLKVCALLSKPDMHEVPHQIDFLGFSLKNEFVVGYGLDLDQKYRNLPYIARILE